MIFCSVISIDLSDYDLSGLDKFIILFILICWRYPYYEFEDPSTKYRYNFRTALPIDLSTNDCSYVDCTCLSFSFIIIFFFKRSN
jgi:hypothetical protein